MFAFLEVCWYRFRPERFLDLSGKVLKKEHFVPFGVGIEICVTKTLYKKKYFVIVPCGAGKIL
jgi:hypothetical protein